MPWSVRPVAGVRCPPLSPGYDQRGSRDRIGYDDAGQAEDLFDQLGRDDARRAALGDNRAVLHRDEVRGVAAGLVEVVQHRDDRPPLHVKLGEQVEQLDLVGDVEEGRGFVEQQDRRLLRQHHRDPDPLALAAGELVDRAGRKRVDARRPHRGRDRGFICPRPLPQERLMRIAAAGDEVGDGDAVRGDRALRQQAEAPRDLLGRALADLPAVEDHLAGSGRKQARQGPQQGRLAAGIGPDDHGERAVGDRDREAGRDRARLVAERQRIRVEARIRLHSTFQFFQTTVDAVEFVAFDGIPFGSSCDKSVTADGFTLDN
ncbi:conserved hypothetical protein [Bosea sp. EC-HK365B]|nr:hypothetical protein BOSE21B_90466 [Bosea sp. 21B]CAD5297483.1 hypothetical protein BOSE7B_60198 [Bosea sp. 7B]VVT61113.1 conserved hypothetical protein [Bosea sp. EC-HK365B]VXB28377.1 hypothetical protein BOSE127_110197 [Bosea sp. 127]